MVGMPEIRVVMMGTRGIRIGMRGIRVGMMRMRGIRARMMRMQGIMVGMWKCRDGNAVNPGGNKGNQTENPCIGVELMNKICREG